MFVCLGVFLYQGVSSPDSGRTAYNVTQDEVDALNKRFAVVIPEPVPAAPGTTSNPPPPSSNGGGNSTPPDTKNPPETPKPVTTATQAKNEKGQLLFNVTYYPTRSKDADDFAKQMFAQLATVFVTVIGFYFGSSTATAGVGTGVKAAGGPAGTGSSPVGSGVPAALQEAKALAHDADADLTRAQTALDLLQKMPESETKPKIVEDAGNTVNSIKTNVGNIHAKANEAIAAAAKYGTASTDAENNAAAALVVKARDEIKPLSVVVKNDADKLEALSKQAAGNK
jgi:hypothetical protein